MGNGVDGVKKVLDVLMKSKVDIADRTFHFARQVVMLCRSAGRSPADRVMTTQLLRCATSIGANVEEAQASQSRADFVSKMSIACKESREASYWLRLMAATLAIPEQRLAALQDESSQLVAILTTIVKNTKSNSLPPKPSS